MTIDDIWLAENTDTFNPLVPELLQDLPSKVSHFWGR